MCVEAELGVPTVLMNDAAAKPAGFFEPFERFATEDWDELMRINATDVVLARQLCGAPMAERDECAVPSSTWLRTPRPTSPGTTSSWTEV